MGNVILTGFMGCGKSSVAIKLSYRLKKAMIDTDKLIEKKQGKTISRIFEEDGEEVFRQLETETLRNLKNSSKNEIISVGGGTPMREENRALMKEMGTVVYLRVSPETVYERVKNDHKRPLLQCEDPLQRISELLEKRGPLYEEGAHVIIDADHKNFGQILFEIERAVRKREMELRGAREGFKKEGYHKYNRAESAENAEQIKETKISQHAQNIQFALNESVQYQETAEEKENETAQTDAAEMTKDPVRLLVINGPNLNFLGIREKGIYGTQDYKYLLNLIARKGIDCGVSIEVFQSNHEGAIIDKLQESYFDGTDGIVINPGAYTHYSYAIRDALACLTVPKVEVHISNIMEREPFRQISVTAPACDKQIYGQGLDGYLQAIDFILDLKKNS